MASKYAVYVYFGVKHGAQRETKSCSDYIDLSPSPSSLIESLRDIGYSIETAIADVIDTSITANSSRIDVRFSWNDGKPWLAIDDGYGMSYGH